MKKFLCIFLMFHACAENQNNPKEVGSYESERVVLSASDSIKVSEYWQKANKLPLYSLERQSYLDSALIVKPDSAYFWQQKAMPLYKERKYSLGKPYLGKAVLYNPKRYLDYSAFMKCLFSKEYQESIAEFKLVKELYGDGYVMDHTYNFYLALDYLQLNQFENAKKYLLKSKEQQFKDFPNEPPEEACHYMDWFYLGVVEYELRNYIEAVKYFDLSLKVYTNFADALYYKGVALYQSGEYDEAERMFDSARANNQNTINEDQVYFVVYPYQVYHKLSPYSRKAIETK